MRDFVELHAPGLAGHVEILHYEDLPGRELSSGTYIFSALDHLTPGGVRFVRELIDQLRHQSARSRVLNDPARVLKRYELLAALHAQGLNRHGTRRATEVTPNVRFPVFVREESEHNGSLTPLLTDRATLQRALGRLVLKGYRLRDLLVVEYCETGDARGRYRRYSAFVVGDRIVARELMVGDGWMLKSHGNAPTRSEIDEENAYVLGNPHVAELRRIFDLAGIDYGRIDYALVAGRIETWEINLNPTIRRGRQLDPNPIPPEVNRLRDPGREHFTRSLESALLAVNTGGTPSRLPVRFSDDCLRGAVPMIRSQDGTWLRQVATALRPAIPALTRVIDAVSPYVAGGVRRLTR
jgi:hypothetical protein